MALDAQSNWNVEMAQPLKIPLRLSKQETQKVPPILPAQTISPSPNNVEVLLPPEIISQILSFIPRRENTQSTFWACCLVSRAWYSASISLLYNRPYLNGGNFAEFVRTVCPSKNAHIRQSTLAVLVRKLDMGELVHNASRSLTARLLGRLKGNIEEFVAPQASFAINSFAALGKCIKLRYLDLSLISASISHKLLFQTLKHLQELETLFFPRSSSPDEEYAADTYTWPQKLKALHLAGGISQNFLQYQLVNAPPSVERLSLQHCNHIMPGQLDFILKRVGPQLQQLTIRHPMKQLYPGSLDEVLGHCSSLTALRISADFITDALFYRLAPGFTHPLRILDIECSPTAGADIGISAEAIYEVVDAGNFPDLRSVRVSARLAWDATANTRLDAKDLRELIEENEMERPLGIATGVSWSMPD